MPKTVNSKDFALLKALAVDSFRGPRDEPNLQSGLFCLQDQLLDRTQLDHIIRVVDGVVAILGLECIEAEFNKKDAILRLFIDWIDATQDKPVSLDDCVQVNRILDEDGGLDQLIADAYTLEVSSPGVERPLRMERHFRAHIGETVLVRLKEKIEGRREVTGTLLSVSDEAQLTVETESGLVSVPLAIMHKANVVFDWAAH